METVNLQRAFSFNRVIVRNRYIQEFDICTFTNISCNLEANFTKFTINPILNCFGSSNSSCCGCLVCSCHRIVHLFIHTWKVNCNFCAFSSSLNCSKDCIGRRGKWSLNIATTPFATFGLTVSESINAITLLTALMP